MHVTRHADPDTFLAAVAPMQDRGEASASLFAGWAHALKRTPPPPDEHVYLATCIESGGCGAAVQRGESPAIVGQSDAAAAAALAEDLAGDWPALQGVVGALVACEAFARRWRDLTGRPHALRFRLRQHALTAVADVPDAPGAPRVAGEADIPWLVAKQLAFVAEVGIHDSPERIRALLPRCVARGEFRIWDDRRPVALAGFNDAPPDFARIAPVYTLPDCRGRGYATALVASLSRELLARGKRKLFLTTDVANPASNAIYTRIGYRPETDEYHFEFVDPDA
jgi:predicted GNAT family acetyltransferase